LTADKPEEVRGVPATISMKIFLRKLELQEQVAGLARRRLSENFICVYAAIGLSRYGNVFTTLSSYFITDTFRAT
jgi:hypothetical protein